MLSLSSATRMRNGPMFPRSAKLARVRSRSTRTGTQYLYHTVIGVKKRLIAFSPVLH